MLRKFVYGTGIDEPVRMTFVEPTADITGDGFVNIDDLITMADAWLTKSGDAGFNYNADLYRDGEIDNADVDVLSENWLAASPAAVYKAYYYHFDGLGSVIALSNTDGEIVETYRYDVYGRANTTGSVGNIYFFTGREYDSETGLYYYRARFYSASIGRFLQTDPTGYGDGINWYLYCGNNPVILVDPDGTFGFTAGILCGPTLSNRKPEKWQGFIPVAGPMANAIYESKQGNVGTALWYNTMAMADWSAVTKTAQVVGKAGQIGWSAVGENILKGELGGNNTTRLYNELGLDGLSAAEKYAIRYNYYGKGFTGVVKTLTPEITSAYTKTILTGPTLASSIGLSASMRGFEYKYNFFSNDSSSSSSSSFRSGGK